MKLEAGSRFRIFYCSSFLAPAFEYFIGQVFWLAFSNILLPKLFGSRFRIFCWSSFLVSVLKYFIAQAFWLPLLNILLVKFFGQRFRIFYCPSFLPPAFEYFIAQAFWLAHVTLCVFYTNPGINLFSRGGRLPPEIHFQE